MTIGSKTAKPTRRMTRVAKPAANEAAPVTKALSKLDQVEGLLKRDAGASIAEIMTATGWQQHSVRGAMAGALKKRGLVITSEKTEGVRRYRAGAGV